MYSNPRCKVLSLSRGLKQGCPLSAYLFIMAIEMLAIKIRPNNNIKGLQTKVSLYADDSCSFKSTTWISTASEDLNYFSNFSGLQPNDKCTILRTILHGPLDHKKIQLSLYYVVVYQ
jgi:hypothetical protein